VVARVDFNSISLFVEHAADPVEATVRGALRGRKKALGNVVVVGDRVRWERESERIVVHEVEPRTNVFSRRASGNQPVEQTVAVNLDQVVVVAAIEDPPFREGFADRVLAQAEHAGIPSLLALNKIDLASTAEVDSILDAYAHAGVAGHAICAKTGAGIEPLRDACRGRRSLILGQSGVGKSTLLNALVPGLGLLAGKVNPKTGKGRHTTTAAWLVRDGGEEWIDTPGVRNFGLWGVHSDDLAEAYHEFRPFLGTCRFSDCRHDKEPGCAIRAAVDRGDIAPLRFDSFHKLRAELLEEEHS
jgi:ribosome biogenesis GTPase